MARESVPYPGPQTVKMNNIQEHVYKPDITDTDVIPVQVKVHCVDYMYFIFVYKIYITKCQNHYEHSQLQKVGSFCSDTW